MSDDRDLFAKYQLGIIGTFEEALDRLKMLHDWDQQTITSLNNKIKKLEDSTYKENKFVELNKQLSEMSHNYYQGFPIPDNEHDKLINWQNQHIQSMHNGRLINGINGGNWIIEFIPTSIGTIGNCICRMCRKKAQSLAFINGEDWSDPDIAKKYLDLYDAKFNFKGV